MLFNFTPGVSGQALAALISSASCPGGCLLSSASLQSTEKGRSRDKTCGQRGPWRADVCWAGRRLDLKSLGRGERGDGWGGLRL